MYRYFLNFAKKLQVKDRKTVSADQFSSCEEKVGPHYNVLFSGGFDSTALLIHHLERGDTVIPFYITFDERTKISANLIISILQTVYGTHKLRNLGSLFGNMYVTAATEFQFCQQAITAFYASFINQVYMENAIATEIAYCKNDDAISYLDDLRSLYTTNLNMRPYQNEILGKRKNSFVPLEFPLTKTLHYENSETVANFEKQHNVILPILSSDTQDAAINTFNAEDSTWYLFSSSDQFLKNRKANKEVCNKVQNEHYIVQIKEFRKKKSLLDSNLEIVT